MSTNEKPRRSTAKPASPPPPEGAEAERIAKYLARAGICSRRDAERLIEEGKVTVDGTVLTTPAFKVTGAERIEVEGRVVGSPPKTRLWRFNKPRGLVVSHKDEQGRPTIFDLLKVAGLPRVISIGRLDLNSEGLLLVTNDGALARQLELPKNAWVRRYKVRVAGEIDVARMEALKKGITIDGVRYGAIDVEIDRVGGLNGWLYVSLTEGKNREIRKVMEHLGLSVNRLQRVSYGPFDLDRLPIGEVAPIGPAIVEKLLKGETVHYEKPVPRPPRKFEAKPKAEAAGEAPVKPAGRKPAARRDEAPGKSRFSRDDSADLTRGPTAPRSKARPPRGEAGETPRGKPGPRREGERAFSGKAPTGSGKAPIGPGKAPAGKPASARPKGDGPAPRKGGPNAHRRRP